MKHTNEPGMRNESDIDRKNEIKKQRIFLVFQIFWRPQIWHCRFDIFLRITKSSSSKDR